MATKTSVFKQGDIVQLKSGGPPMTVDKIPGEDPYRKDEYLCRWFKGATADFGHYREHLLEAYVNPAKK